MTLAQKDVKDHEATITWSVTGVNISAISAVYRTVENEQVLYMNYGDLGGQAEGQLVDVVFCGYTSCIYIF